MAELQDHSWIKTLSGEPKLRFARPARGCDPPRRGMASDETRPPAVAQVIGRLVRSNIESLQLARGLLAAQEAADAHEVEAGLAVDNAATSDADPDAIEAAVQAVAEANAASTHEADLSNLWSMHRLEVYELVTHAVQLLGSMPEEVAADPVAADPHVREETP